VADINRRKFLTRGAAATGAVTVAASAGKAQETPSTRVICRKKPAKTPPFNSTVAYGNLLLLSGVGYHKDWAAMNDVFQGAFGPEPPVRTTIAAPGGIPGNSLVEIDVIACL
jgi:2-iminobutanoate/2-iminopropanoate deaminase